MQHTDQLRILEQMDKRCRTLEQRLRAAAKAGSHQAGMLGRSFKGGVRVVAHTWKACWVKIKNKK